MTQTNTEILRALLKDYKEELMGDVEICNRFSEAMNEIIAVIDEREELSKWQTQGI